MAQAQGIYILCHHLSPYEQILWIWKSAYLHTNLEILAHFLAKDVLTKQMQHQQVAILVLSMQKK